jgi:hypothetical protein
MYRSEQLQIGDATVADRFISYLACKSLAPVSPEALVSRIGELFPGTPLKAQAVAGAPNQPLDSGFLLGFGGALISVIQVDKPLPGDAYSRALKLDRVWPDAAQTMAAHGAHIIVATLKEVGSHLEALNGAVQVTMTLAALATMVPGLAVVWTNGDVITEAGRFQEVARALVQRQIRPDIWIGFDWLDGPPLSGGQRTLAVVTTGLEPFIGRDVEWLPTALPPGTIASRLLGLCQYLIINGPVIKDGESLGISETERIRARFAERGQYDRPVMQLSVEQLDASPSRAPTTDTHPSKPATEPGTGFGKRKPS